MYGVRSSVITQHFVDHLINKISAWYHKETLLLKLKYRKKKNYATQTNPTLINKVIYN